MFSIFFKLNRNLLNPPPLPKSQPQGDEEEDDDKKEEEEHEENKEEESNGEDDILQEAEGEPELQAKAFAGDALVDFHTNRGHPRRSHLAWPPPPRVLPPRFARKGLL